MLRGAKDFWKMKKGMLEEEELSVGVKGRRIRERHGMEDTFPDFSNNAEVGQQVLWKRSDRENEIRRSKTEKFSSSRGLGPGTESYGPDSARETAVSTGTVDSNSIWSERFNLKEINVIKENLM